MSGNEGISTIEATLNPPSAAIRRPARKRTARTNPLEIWCLGLDWDDKLPKQLEVSWNKWCNEIHYLSEIKIPRYYFQNFLSSNATTIQLHCFSDASKKAYGTVAYLRIELNDGKYYF
ncbi:integrase catalytic domain-containing protein [Trichonephila clavipes]|nr:integrase catalytic domain-containing protein [Trichonephila clavipes]